MRMMPSALETISQLRHPGLIAAMSALTNYREQSLTQQAAGKQQDDESMAEASLTIKDGRPVINIKNLPASDANDEADQTNAVLDQALQTNMGIFRALNDRAAAAGPVESKDKAWKKNYATALNRTHGGIIGSMIARDIADAAPPEPTPETKIAADYYKENVEPLLQQSVSTKRFERVLSKDELKEIQSIDYSAPGAAGQDPSRIAETVLGHPIKPAQAALAKLVAFHQTAARETARAKTAADATSKLNVQDVAGLDTDEDRQKYVETVASTIPGGMNPVEKDKLQTRVNGLVRRYKSLDDREKAQLQLERERVATAQRQNEVMEQSAANAQNPESISSAVKQIELDPQAYYTPQMLDKKNSAFKQAVDNALVAKHGRVPSKPNTDDVKAISFARLGLMDLDAMDAKVAKWEQVGVPLTGAAVGRYNEAEGKFGSPTRSTVDARRLIPNFNKLSAQQQQDYIADAQYYNTRANVLLTREVKLATGGRGGQYMLPIIKSSTPGIFTGGPIRTGRVSALRDEFNNRLSVSRSNSWGGVDPLEGSANADAGATGAVITDPNAILSIFKKKK